MLITKLISEQTHHVYSTWNPRDVFAGLDWFDVRRLGLCRHGWRWRKMKRELITATYVSFCYILSCIRKCRTTIAKSFFKKKKKNKSKPLSTFSTRQEGILFAA